MKRILILSDRRPGHYNQTLAVAEAIGRVVPAEVVYREVSVRKVGKYLLRALLNCSIGRQGLAKLRSIKAIDFFYRGYDEEVAPDIVISAGKDTSLLNAWFGLDPRILNVYIGNPKKLDPRLFRAVLSVLDLGLENQIVLDVAPTRPYEGDIEAFAETLQLQKGQPYYALLIGGDGAGYRYRDEDIEALIAMVNTMAVRNGVQWLVTTSRRTSVTHETAMYERMDAACFIPYHRDPQKVVAGFLELAEAVFVTEDSASMVSEGVAFRKPVVTLRPAGADGDDPNYEQILEKFRRDGRIRRTVLSEAGEAEISAEGFTPLDRTSVEEIAEKLRPFLHE